MKSKIWFGLGCLVAVMASVWILYSNITLNFLILSLFFLLGGIILGNVYDVKTTNDDKFQRGIGILFIALAVLGVCKTLSNYFYADNDVYSNSDHHAVRIDGVKLLKPKGFVLAGNSDVAFLDNDKYHGTLTIKNYDSQSVTLKAHGFTQALYREIYTADLKRESAVLLNKESLIGLQADDKLQFIGKRDTCELSWFYQDVEDILWNPMKDAPKECKYVYSTRGERDTVSYTTIIKKGLDLNSIYGEVLSDIGFSGMNLLREQYYSESEENEYYTDKPFVLELNNALFERNALREIRVLHSSGKTTSFLVSELKRKTQEITIPIGTAFSIGCIADGKSVSVRFRTEGEQLLLDYVNPQYHPLSSVNKKGSNNIYITTSLATIVQDQNPPQNIMFFDLFHKDENVNHFKKPIFLSYISGPTTQEMCFLVNRKVSLKSNEYVPNVVSKSGAVAWNMQIENFKDTVNHLNENNILLFFVVLGICMIICISFGRPLGGVIKYHGLLEILAYLLMLLLFAFRVLLLWRAAMFSPVELASIYELNHFFRNQTMIVWQFIGLNFFFAVILSVKLNLNPYPLLNRWRDVLVLYIPMSILTVAEIWLFKIEGISALMKLFVLPLGVYLVVSGLFLLFSYEKYKNFIQLKWSSLVEKKTWQFYACVIGFFALVGLLLLLLDSDSVSTVAKILIPISCYFFLEAIIWKCWPGISDGIYQDIQGMEHFSGKDILSSGLGLSLLNGLTFTIIFIFLDGGYGIMFLSFYMFVTIVKLYDFICSFISYNQQALQKRKHVFHVLVVFVLALLCALFFFFYKSILAWFATVSIIWCSLIVTFVLIGLIWTVLSYIWGIKLGFTTVLVSLLLAISITGVMKYKVLTKHTQQRVNVHALSLEDGLRNTNTSADERRFFEASVNDYILNVYNEQSEKVSAVGDGGAAYFKMQPHSKVGAMFGAQTSDILLARFVIAEHGKWLPFIFISLVLLMLYWAIKVKTKYRASKMLLIQIPGLLFMHMLFVWLANTRLFIFLGQDFPLLSLHSKLAILYFCILLSVWVGIATFEKIQGLIWTYECNKRRIAQPYYYQKVGLIFVSIIGGMLLLFGWVYTPRADERYGNAVYSLEGLLKETTDKMEQVNELFTTFQKETRMSVSNLSDVSSIIYAFNEKHKDEIQTLLDGEGSFHYRIWEKFAVKGGAKNNSSASLIHVRRKNQKLNLEVREGFFDKNLPVVEKKSWHGNVVAHKESDGNTRAISQNASFRQYVIPSDWVVNAEDVVLLKKIKKAESVINNDSELHADFSVGRGYTSACRRFVQDRLDSEGLENLASNTYFARNVVINGRRSFVYPMGEKFFWAYTFANEVAYQKNKKGDKDSKDFHDDVAITIDKNLSAEIYDIIGKTLGRNSKTYLSVIAADGDGQIRTMVDLKPGYVLNPNNSREMNRIADELYMDFNSSVNDAYFGNLNLMNMKDGPGSSQKPIVWTAVASAIDYDWKNLQIYNFSQGGPYAYGKEYHISQFNGEVIYPGKASERAPKDWVTFAALQSDENYGRGVNLSDFMHHSSNFYNALMLYIGSYSSVNMKVTNDKNHDETAMFTKLPSGVYNAEGYALREVYDKNFPILTKNQNGSSGLFKLNQKMSRDFKESILFTQLHDMFGFNNQEEDICSLYDGLNLRTSVKQRRSTYAFGASPYYQYNLNDISTDRGYLRTAIHQAAVGGGAVWQVAPWSMAQTFGRLTMLKKNYQLTFEPVKQDDKQFITYSESELSEGYLDARSLFLSGMNKVFAPDGTIKSFKAKGPGPYKKGDYYIYGKTGTANEANSANTRLHRLGLVITNKNIENLTIEELKDVKFYSVYFTAWNPYGDCYSRIVDKIIESESFKRYMEK